MPSTAVLTQLVNALVEAGGADLDYAALGTVLFGMSGVGEKPTGAAGQEGLVGRVGR